MSEEPAPYRTKAKKAQPEQELQKAVVIYIRAQYPNVLFWHTPNGGKRNAIEAGIFKGLGVVAGVPDLFIAHPSRFQHGLFIELKSKKGKLSENQKEVCKKLCCLGYAVVAIHSIEEVVNLLQMYIKEHTYIGFIGFD